MQPQKMSFVKIGQEMKSKTMELLLNLMEGLLSQAFNTMKDNLKEIVRGGCDTLIASLIVGLASFLGILVMALIYLIK